MKTFEEINPDFEPLSLYQSTDCPKMCDCTKQIEDSGEPRRRNNSELSVIEILRSIPHGHHAANLQLNLKTMQHSSYESRSAVRLLQQVFTTNNLSKL